MPDRFTVADAVGWTLLLMVGCWVCGILILGLLPKAAHDLVTAGGIEVIVFLAACALFASRRPGQSWSELFAMRAVSVPGLIVALALGVALFPPAQRLALLVHSAFPLPKEILEEREAMARIRSPLHGALLFLVAAGAGPFAEELFFRGALFTALRRHARTLVTVGTTALLFTLIHPDPRTWAPILPLALVLSAVRSRTGSLFAALLVHAGFNGASVATTPALPSIAVPGPALVFGGLAAAVVLFAALFWLGNGAAARHARELDGGVSS